MIGNAILILEMLLRGDICQNPDQIRKAINEVRSLQRRAESAEAISDTIPEEARMEAP